MRTLLKHALTHLMPQRCLWCRLRTPKNQWLCGPCLTYLPRAAHRCVQCALPMPTTHRRCGKCQRTPPAFESVHCPFIYTHPLDSWLKQFKFNAKFAAVEFFADAILDCIVRAYPAHALPDALVPIPLHWRRLRQRGFNQATVIAQQLAKVLQLPCLTQLCRRTRATKPQTGLPETARRHNLANAFTVATTPMLAKLQHIALVDDVMTTGQTAHVLAKQFKSAGIQRIELWCVARTPAPQETKRL